MQMVIKSNGKEVYKREMVHPRLAKEMEEAGHFLGFNKEWGYIEGKYPHSTFSFRGKNYRIEKFNGNKFPFLLESI